MDTVLLPSICSTPTRLDKEHVVCKVSGPAPSLSPKPFWLREISLYSSTKKSCLLYSSAHINTNISLNKSLSPLSFLPFLSSSSLSFPSLLKHSRLQESALHGGTPPPRIPLLCLCLNE